MRSCGRGTKPSTELVIFSFFVCCSFSNNLKDIFDCSDFRRRANVSAATGSYALMERAPIGAIDLTTVLLQYARFFT